VITTCRSQAWNFTFVCTTTTRSSDQLQAPFFLPFCLLLRGIFWISVSVLLAETWITLSATLTRFMSHIPPNYFPPIPEWAGSFTLYPVFNMDKDDTWGLPSLDTSGPVLPVSSSNLTCPTSSPILASPVTPSAPKPSLPQHSALPALPTPSTASPTGPKPKRAVNTCQRKALGKNCDRCSKCCSGRQDGVRCSLHHKQPPLSLPQPEVKGSEPQEDLCRVTKPLSPRSVEKYQVLQSQQQRARATEVEKRRLEDEERRSVNLFSWAKVR
jgi:hypothetical protein